VGLEGSIVPLMRSQEQETHDRESAPTFSPVQQLGKLGGAARARILLAEQRAGDRPEESGGAPSVPDVAIWARLAKPCFELMQDCVPRQQLMTRCASRYRMPAMAASP
jgi:hypothetical protein